ncbi:MAG: hypothetical protein JOZ47_17125 [Kutzneria sp.]|nr:hypothetical protein [Kutzneria sp.]MBV9846767.1 hypothetical protein [Kutzneria sp.]
MLRLPLVVAHLTMAAVWLGSMTYSLAVVQPKTARFFPSERAREDFLVVLAHGNRWRVVALVAALLITDTALYVLTGGFGYLTALPLYAIAGGIFVHVSWRHWPARVFALDHELAGYRKRLRIMATTMTALVGAAFLVVLTWSVR